MSSNLKRILITLLISVVGLYSTSFYFTKFYPSLHFRIDEKPLAKVEDLENTSRKKLAEHRTWQIVEFGDSLYSGEMIKTSADSDMSIRFLDSGTILNLEADSLITIRNNKGDISLNLIEGNLFVDSSNSTAASSLKLESKEGLIDLAKATANLSKQKNSELNVNVMSGQASLVDKSGQRSELKVKKEVISITSPLQLSSLESKTAEIKLVWLSGVPTLRENITFKVGTKRSDLIEVQPVSLSNNEAVIPAKFGKNFVQIEVRSVSETESPQIAAVRFELKPIIEAAKPVGNASITQPFAPPTPVAEKPVVVAEVPEIIWADESEEKQTYLDIPEIDLKWNIKNSESVKKVVIKIREGDKLLLSELVPVTQTNFKTKMANPGRYIASIEALDQAEKTLSQSKLKSIVSEQLPHLNEVKWVDGKGKAAADLNGSYLAKWQPMESVEHYTLQLINSKGAVVKTWNQKKNFIQLNNLLPGEYKLTVATLDENKRISPNKSTKLIEVTDGSAIVAPKLKKMRFK